MDPFTHAALGVAAAIAIAGPATRRRHAAVAGLAAGLLPDIDIFFRSADDALAPFRWHRHFTHSYAFTPVIAAAGAGLAWLILIRRAPRYRELILPAWAAAMLHLINDAGTSYGTLLYWPFNHTRIAWDCLPIIDPLALTLPAALLAGYAVVRRSRVAAVAALGWFAAYAALGVVQRERAEGALRAYAATCGHTPERVAVKPSPLSLLLWRGVYMESGYIRAVAIRPGAGGTRLWPGESAQLAIPGRDKLPLRGTAAGDAVADFQHFTHGWLIALPRPDGTTLVGDARFSMLPQGMTALWGIAIDTADPTRPATLVMRPSTAESPYRRFFGMILDNADAGPGLDAPSR